MATCAISCRATTRSSRPTASCSARRGRDGRDGLRSSRSSCFSGAEDQRSRAGGVAHDQQSSPSSALRGAHPLRSGMEGRVEIKQIRGAAERAASSRQLLAFAPAAGDGTAIVNRTTCAASNSLRRVVDGDHDRLDALRRHAAHSRRSSARASGDEPAINAPTGCRRRLQFETSGEPSPAICTSASLISRPARMR